MTLQIKYFRGEYFFLSNFSPHSFIDLDDNYWKTSEHYYQAQKAINEDDFKKIQNALSPGKAKKLGNLVVMRNDWNKIKDSIMIDALYFKFSQNENIKQKLIDTKGIYLEEGNNWNDTYWGVCNGKGSNKLGKYLMELRESLINEMLINDLFLK